MMFFLFLMLPFFAQADLDDNGNVVLQKNQFICESEIGKLSFELNLSTFTVEFSDVSAFGRAEIQKNIPFGMKVDFQEQFTEVNFAYNWYFTADYTLKLPAISEWVRGKGNLILNGDDGDGIWFRNQIFTCTIQ
jgi:hypothetical protein